MLILLHLADFTTTGFAEPIHGHEGPSASPSGHVPVVGCLQHTRTFIMDP